MNTNIHNPTRLETALLDTLQKYGGTLEINSLARLCKREWIEAVTNQIDKLTTLGMVKNTFEGKRRFVTFKSDTPKITEIVPRRTLGWLP